MNRALDEARNKSVAWGDDRHARVLASIHKTRASRARRSRAISIALSSLLGTALIVLAARALGSSSATHEISPYAQGDGGREN